MLFAGTYLHLFRAGRGRVYEPTAGRRHRQERTSSLWRQRKPGEKRSKNIKDCRIGVMRYVPYPDDVWRVAAGRLAPVDNPKSHGDRCRLSAHTVPSHV